MRNKNLLKSETISSTDNASLIGSAIRPVDDLILQRKKFKKQLKKNRWLKRLWVLILTLVLGLLSTFYLKTSISTVQQINISGNHLLSKQEILQKLEVNTLDSLWKLDFVELNKRLLELDLISSGKVALDESNTLQIVINEKKGVGLVVLITGVVMLSDQGEFLKLDTQRLLMNLNLPLIVGIEEPLEIQALALALSTLNDEILVNISEIHKEKTAFNEPQIRLMMQEGNIVFTPLSALSALDKYLQVVKMTNEKNSCFYIADIGFSLVKAACPTH